MDAAAGAKDDFPDEVAHHGVGQEPAAAASDTTPLSGDYSPPQTCNRFSKFAPSQDLSPNDFRAQLKENLKRDLERRRQQDPNRGNQPAKSYLDSL